MNLLVQEREGIRKLPSLLSHLQCRRPLLVCGNSFRRSRQYGELKSTLAPVEFSAFTPNPRLSEIKEGVAVFHANACDALVAVGGGSAMDVAKCIKLFCRNDPKTDWLKEAPCDTGIPLVAVPTTAGTGSEATHFAVVYHENVKYSVAHPSLCPQAAVLDPDLLTSLPPYQKACSMMDALCQAIESHWSVRATEKSIAFARAAVKDIVTYGRDYVMNNCSQAAEKVLLAAHRAGCAINLTTTTAAHAMSYQLTKLYDLPHGHSVSLCLGEVWREMLAHPSPCAHPLGEQGLKDCFRRICEDLGVASPEEALTLWQGLLEDYGLHSPVSRQREAELSHLCASVNPARLGNNPVSFSQDTLYRLYERIVK